MFDKFEEWKAIALRMGATIENNGGDRLVAHIDGEELGEWNPEYGGVGVGYFYG